MPRTSIQRLLLWVVLSMLVCGLLNPGNFGTVDTTRRLQVARWIRRGEPPVAPAETSFGLVGRDGLRHAWYGIGQSLVLIPFDALVSNAVLPRLSRSGLDSEKQQQIITLLIAFFMQWCVTGCSLALAYQVLRAFHFTDTVSLAGVLALLFGTTYLQYVQSAQENNLLLLLTLLALYCVRRWQEAGAARWAVVSGLACGLAILVRLTSVLETVVLFAFAVSLRRAPKQFLLAFAPPVLCALLVDRWYQWFRFGELFSTYMGVFGRQARPVGASASFPFSYPFWKGFLGTLFSADKSIFLFDPLLLVLCAVLLWNWRAIGRETRTAILWMAVLLVLYIGTYATYFDFGGDVAWGHRFVTLPVQLLSLFSVPLLLTYGAAIPALARRAAWLIVFGSVILQATSTAVAPNLEVLQRDMGYGHGVIVDRGINLARLALGREVRGSERIPEEWRSLYYLPFQLRFHFPALARWAIEAWIALLVCLLVLVSFMIRFIKTESIAALPQHSRPPDRARGLGER